MKLYESRQKRAFATDDLHVLSKRIGIYSDVQSMHSEDALTWSFFGPLAWSGESTRVAWLNWLVAKLGIEAAEPNTHCSIDLWRRVPHPDTAVPGGPELDLLVTGDQAVIFAEAKWRSAEGKGQGKAKNKGQMQIRRDWFSRYGACVYPDRTLVVLGVVRDEKTQADAVADNPPALTRWIEWDDLAACPHHPCSDEVRRYLAWKRRHSLPV